MKERKPPHDLKKRATIFYLIKIIAILSYHPLNSNNCFYCIYLVFYVLIKNGIGVTSCQLTGCDPNSHAAYRVGISTIIIPKDNEKDLENVDDVLKQAIKNIYKKK